MAVYVGGLYFSSAQLSQTSEGLALLLESGIPLLRYSNPLFLCLHAISQFPFGGATHQEGVLCWVAKNNV